MSNCPRSTLLSLQGDGTRAYQSRFDPSIKDDPDAQEQMATQPLFSQPALALDGADRSLPTRRPFIEQEASIHRAEWGHQYSNAHYEGNYGSRGTFLAETTYSNPWPRQAAGVSYIHPGEMGGWAGAGPSPSGGALEFAEHERREPARMVYQGMGYIDAPMPPGGPLAQTMLPGIDQVTGTDLFQSEFFVEAMQPKREDAAWSHLDPCMLTAQTTERVRIESAPGPSPQNLETSLAASMPMVSPSGQSATAADSYFAVDFRALCDQAAPSEPPNAGQVEQIMADLGIDYAASQTAAADASQEALTRPDPQPPAAAPSIPSQGETPAPWNSDRFASSSTSFHPHQMSQAQSSQTSFYLPSLTASQTEYLGPNATSHRRTIDRVISNASMVFEPGSQSRDLPETQDLPGDFGERLGKSIRSSNIDSDSQKTSIRNENANTNANFHKPHDSFPSHWAAMDEEGGWKAARIEESQHRSAPSSNSSKLVSRLDSKGAEESRKDIAGETVAVDTTAADLMGPPRPIQDPTSAANDKAEMEIDEPPLPEDAPQRNSSSSIATSAVSGDQLQVVVERFRAFARLCQDHMHPSTELLETLAPLIPKVIHSDVPVFHPKMVGSQKAHSPEEAFALLSLASLRSNDQNLKEEGDRLISFLYGLVMLSYKHTIHLGGTLHSFLNCLILVGVHGMRQTNPDLWEKFEENRESILLDVLRAETSNAVLDKSMDRIEPGGLQDLPEEDLFELWSRWYDHESRKRSRLFGAILDSQSSSYFSPLKIKLTSRLEGPRCQYLFAHVHEPCPDAIFLAWPPKVWATRLASNASLPSSKGADLAFRDGQPASIAACLTERLLKPHVAHLHGSTSYPRFRSSFDFGAGSYKGPMSKLSHPTGDGKDREGTATSTESVNGDDTSSSSTRSSRQQSQAELPGTRTLDPETRTVSQLYMLALLEAVHGAWTTDSGWYQTPAWGAAALPEQLAIDNDDFDIDNASLADLPGWRIGRTLHATQVAHALMNWSEMFSGWNVACQKSGEAAVKLGFKVTDDAYQATVRWQATFLSLCVPLQSLCFYLDASKRNGVANAERHRRLSLLLRKWADSSYCRRALVHAGTIITLLCAARKENGPERLSPTAAHAVFMSLVVLVGTRNLLCENADLPARGATNVAHRSEELIPSRQVWTTLLGADSADESKDKERKNVVPKDESDQDPESVGDEEWLRVRFWHRKFQYLGLAGIFRGPEASCEVYSDWRGSVSIGAEAGPSSGPLRAAHLRPRWSSFVGEGGWPRSRRETVHVQHHSFEDYRRSSHAPFTGPQADLSRQLPRLQIRSSTGITNAWQETRRWILQGMTQSATFCGMALLRTQEDRKPGPSVIRSRDDTEQVLDTEQLRELVLRLRGNNPAWCYSQEYTSLLLGALQEPRAEQHHQSAAFASEGKQAEQPREPTRV